MNEFLLISMPSDGELFAIDADEGGAALAGEAIEKQCGALLGKAFVMRNIEKSVAHGA